MLSWLRYRLGGGSVPFITIAEFRFGTFGELEEGAADLASALYAKA